MVLSLPTRMPRRIPRQPTWKVERRKAAGKNMKPPPPPPPEPEAPPKWYRPRNVLAAVALGVACPTAFSIALKMNHDLRESVNASHPNVIVKVREWFDIGKLDSEKNVWELVEEEGAFESTAKQEATVTVHGGQYTFAVEPQTSRSALLVKVHELTGLTVDMDEKTGPVVSFVDEAESL